MGAALVEEVETSCEIFLGTASAVPIFSLLLFCLGGTQEAPTLLESFPVVGFTKDELSMVTKGITCES